MNLNVEIAQDSNKWNLYKEIDLKLLKNILGEVIGNYPNLSRIKNIELSILLTSNRRIKKLNQQFRNINCSTNVLSFPDLEIDFRQILELKMDLNYIYLGDVAFAFEKMCREAKKRNISFINHFKHLLVHSILHLLGYDHIKDAEAELMEAMETKVLERLKVPSPYLQQISSI